MSSVKFLFTVLDLLLLTLFTCNALQDNALGTNESFDKLNKAHNPKASNVPSTGVNIANFTSCRRDLERYCPVKTKDNFLLLACLKGSVDHSNELNPDCEHDLWNFQSRVTTNGFFADFGSQVCRAALEALPICSEREMVTAIGGELFCLLEHREKISSVQHNLCYEFLKTTSRIIFADLARIKPFLVQCEASIQKYRCGRLPNTNSSALHSQEDVLDCLATRVNRLPASCRTQIQRLSELRATDYQLDLRLFLACREAREDLCASVKSGEGRILQCLMNKKFDVRMRPACRKELVRRQKLRAVNYKTDATLVPCRSDIAQYNCNTATDVPDTVRLSSVLLCLEKQQKLDADAIKSECLVAMRVVRRQLMEDYRISPNLAVKCEQDIMEKCAAESKQRQGLTLHCLMQFYIHEPTNNTSSSSALRIGCKAALRKLVAVVDPSSHVQVDPVVSSACSSAIHSEFCRDFNLTGGNPRTGGRMYSCLNYLILHPRIDTPLTLTCKNRLTQLQYVLLRDFTFNDQLFRACHRDAVRVCDATPQWFVPQDLSMNPAQTHVTFTCLFQRSRDVDLGIEKAEKNVSSKCRREIRRIMHMQARRVQLNPELYEACLPDLGLFCSQSAANEEYHCLQTNLDKLQLACRGRVVQFSQAQSRDLSLDLLFVKACSAMARRFCPEVIKQGQSTTADMLRCLVHVKKDVNMETQCRAAIEHRQILALSDYQISFRFTKYCSDDIKELCPNEIAKPKVVSCLSRQVLLETLGDVSVSSHRVSPLCRQQLQFELFQRSDSYQLDLQLQRVCAADVRRYCSREKAAKQGVTACLEARGSDLEKACYEKVFRRQQLLVVDSGVDADLHRKCGPMIRRHCPKWALEKQEGQMKAMGDNEVKTSDDSSNLLYCLKKAQTVDRHFNSECTRVLVARVAVQRQDYRLDPVLKANCQNDISRYCQIAASKLRVEVVPKENQGLVTQCLKDQYRNNVLLEGPCAKHIRQVILESNLNYNLDPRLKAACESDVRSLCGKELEHSEAMDGSGRVVECLKRSLLNRKIIIDGCKREVFRMLQEGRADVHVDPVLYGACLPELQNPKLCGQVALGGGRQFGCLLDLTKTSSTERRVSTACAKEVRKRREMWEFGAKQFPGPDGMLQLAETIQQSGSRTYLWSILGLVVLLTFILGACLGRCSKRAKIKYELLTMKEK